MCVIKLCELKGKLVSIDILLVRPAIHNSRITLLVLSFHVGGVVSSLAHETYLFEVSEFPKGVELKYEA